MPIASVIKYEGTNNTFIWKHPCEDFNNLTQLIVHESQEAVFFMNGQALDLFGPGRHTLSTQNIPIIGKLLNLTTGGETPFHCEVYFINKTVQMAVKWGTDSRVRYIDPTFGVPLDIGASGEMNLMVSDSRKLLLKLVGTMHGIAWENQNLREQDFFTRSLNDSFKPIITTVVKANLANAIKSSNINILDIDFHLEELSGILRQSILPTFEEYGLTIPQFYLSTVSLPDERDKNFRQIRDLYSVSLQTQTAHAKAVITAAQREKTLEEEATKTEIAKREAERKLIAAQTEAEIRKTKGFAEAAVMSAQGYTKKDEMAVEAQKAYATGIGNMSGTGGGVASDLVGVVAGMKVAGIAMDNMNFMGRRDFGAEDIKPNTQNICKNCQKPLPENAKFCLECGTPVLNNANEIVCPLCGQRTPDGRFCIQCGNALSSQCPNCDATLPAGAKFCLECGTKIN